MAPSDLENPTGLMSPMKNPPETPLRWAIPTHKQPLLMPGAVPAKTEMNARQADVAATVTWRMTVAGLIAGVAVTTLPVA